MSRAAAALALGASLTAALLLGLALLAPAPASATDPAASIRPHIVKKSIPFGAARKAQMANYCQRHYHQHRWALKHPKVIVLHFTAGADWKSAWNTFAANSAYMSTDGVWEKPGVSAHFIVGKRGTIYQCVPLGYRARHAIGMNWTAIGIEIVQEVPAGKTGHWADQRILHRSKQITAALKLVRYLKARFLIKNKNVIGHAMANNSPYFRDYTGAKNATGDWIKRDVIQFRARL
jgi:N-acetylmuramoyl-L-alanine amidase